MKIYAEKLQPELKRGLKPIYLISGDVPLLVQEAADAIRSLAGKAGFSERIAYRCERDFDWGTLRQVASHLSLFGEKKLLELHIPTAKPGDAGSKALQAYAEHLGDDVILLIIAGKLDGPAQRTRWYKALDKVGLIVQVWPIRLGQLPAWIKQRMQQAELQATGEGIQLLVERIEGNLLAAVQEIEKLRSLYGSGSLSVEQIADAVTDNARFDLFALPDSVLGGDSRYALRILSGLRAEGVEPTLILWSLTREIRMLMGMHAALDTGKGVDQVLGQYYVWEKRKPLIRQVLQRRPETPWDRLLLRAAHIDRTLKGVQPGNVWDELSQLCLMITGAIAV